MWSKLGIAFFCGLTGAITFSFLPPPKTASARVVQDVDTYGNFLSQCSKDLKEYQCFILYRHGEYPPQPIISMGGTAFSQIIERTSPKK